MQAHHLIPANVWGALVSITPFANKAGWEPNTPTNLIALPANEATQARLTAEGLALPIHKSSHSDYDATTLGEIAIERARYEGTPTPAQARAIFENVSAEMRKLILAGRWMPRLY